MIRKTLLALAATAALGVVALAPTAASAFPPPGPGPGPGPGPHGHPHFFGGPGFGGPGFGIGIYDNNYLVQDCYYVKKPTRFGYKLIQVCG